MLCYGIGCTSTKLEFGVAGVQYPAGVATGKNPKSSSVLLLNGVSGFGAAQRYQFQPETPLRTIRSHEENTSSNRSKACISGKTQDAQAQLGGLQLRRQLLHSRLTRDAET